MISLHFVFKSGGLRFICNVKIILVLLGQYYVTDDKHGHLVFSAQIFSVCSKVICTFIFIEKNWSPYYYVLSLQKITSGLKD